MEEKKSYELITSNNMQYVAGICKKNIVNEMYEMKIWDGKTMCEISTLFVCVDLGGSRFAVSNDGKCVATARYEDYEDGTIFIYKVESGENIFRNQSLRRIQWLMFEDSETLMVGTENSGIYFFDIISGDCKTKIKGKNFVIISLVMIFYYWKKIKLNTEIILVNHQHLRICV